MVNNWMTAFTIIGVVWAICWLLVRTMWPPKYIYIIKAMEGNKQ